MSNSALVDYIKISPNCNKPRNKPITKITIHHMAGNMTVEALGAVEAKASRAMSSNYGVGTDGRVGLYCEEANRSWCSSSYANDQTAITIEVANDGGAPNWHVSDKALAKVIDLCADICQRNGIKALRFTGDSSGNLTQHNYFAATACPGPYLKGKFAYIAAEVNKRLTGETDTGATGSAAKSIKASGTAKYRLASLTGTYKATEEANVRDAAGFDSRILVAIPKDTRVKCYGYYSTVPGSSIKWLYVLFDYNGCTYTAFISKNILRKV